MMRRQAAERRQGIGNLDGDGRRGNRAAGHDQGRGGPRFRNLRQETVRIVMLALQRHKQRPRRHAPRVGDHAAYRALARAHDPAAGHVSDLREREAGAVCGNRCRHQAPFPSAAIALRACCRSSKGNRSSPIS